MPDSSSWLLYFGVLIGPFIQEDAAVLTAATLSVNNMANTQLLYVTILVGLFLSDIWKYWIGWAAIKNQRAQKFVARKHVSRLQSKVRQHLFLTLLTTRFLPLARVPAYVACGLFHVSYPKFCLYILFTAFLYVTAIFAICHILGEIVGDHLKWAAPVIILVLGLIYVGYMLMKKKVSFPSDVNE